ncbi:HLF transcription factor, PAR bZIP family member a [Antennarius striatus]|uniref:HLF transcription factor, PAR bZIP family member a n=1 Tax=Antennarius striatus TaxID=241820 RepID=UPI0035B1BA41
MNVRFPLNAPPRPPGALTSPRRAPHMARGVERLRPPRPAPARRPPVDRPPAARRPAPSPATCLPSGRRSLRVAWIPRAGGRSVSRVRSVLRLSFSGKMSRPLPAGAFLPPTHGVLKSLLENPLKLPFQHDEGFKDKEKKKLEEEGGASHPQSAFLGPTLWDKTLPYDADNFQLEYMDLEEFLSENGIPASTAQSEQAPPPPQQTPPSTPPAPATPSVVDLSSRASTSVHAGLAPQGCLRTPSTAALPSARDTPSPIDPESIQVPLTYEPDPADLALSSVPGQEMFDPRKRKFSAEELKPQPMIKKARKVFIPEDMKDDRYWARRRKNNVAAKRSRDARRLKENQIAIRAGFLEKENAALRLEVADMRKELGRCRNIVAKYEARHGPL